MRRGRRRTGRGPRRTGRPPRARRPGAAVPSGPVALGRDLRPGPSRHAACEHEEGMTTASRNESAAGPVSPSASSPYNPGEKQMSVSDETTTVSDGILLSDAAASKVKTLLDQEGRDDLALRVAVQPGGCSGLRY